MKRIFLIAFLSFQLLTIPAIAQISPNEAMNSSGKSEIVTAQKMPGNRDKIVPEVIEEENKYDAYKKRIIKLEALVEKQDELIEVLKPRPITASEQEIEQLFQEVAKRHDAVKLAPIPSGSGTQPWSQELVMFLIVSILVFGILVLIVMAVLCIKGKDADKILRMCALPLIIVAAIFLVVTGYSIAQISPVMGLLGAIAGYLLGSKRTGDSVPPRSDPPNGRS